MVMSGDYVEHPKPAPDTFLVTAEKLGMEPEDCLVVEDSTNGGGAARAAGMKCIWFHNRIPEGRISRMRYWNFRHGPAEM